MVKPAVPLRFILNRCFVLSKPDKRLVLDNFAKPSRKPHRKAKESANEKARVIRIFLQKQPQGRQPIGVAASGSSTKTSDHPFAQPPVLKRSSHLSRVNQTPGGLQNVSLKNSWQRPPRRQCPRPSNHATDPSSAEQNLESEAPTLWLPPNAESFCRQCCPNRDQGR